MEKRKFDILFESLINQERDLEQRAQDEDVMVRVALAHEKNLPQDIIKKLANDSDWVVRADIAERDDVPVEVLEELSYDNDVTVLERVCGNKNTPAWILEKITDKICDANIDFSNASDKHTTLVMNIIKNKVTYPDTLLKINNLKLSQYLRSELNCHIPKKYRKY